MDVSESESESSSKLAEVMERLRIMARSSVVAAMMLANEERHRQLSVAVLRRSCGRHRFPSA